MAVVTTTSHFRRPLQCRYTASCCIIVIVVPLRSYKWPRVDGNLVVGLDVYNGKLLVCTRFATPVRTNHTDRLCKYIWITFGMLVYSMLATCLTTVVRFTVEVLLFFFFCSLPCLYRLRGPPTLLSNRVTCFNLKPTWKILQDLSPFYTSSGVRFPAETGMSRPALRSTHTLVQYPSV